MNDDLNKTPIAIDLEGLGYAAMGWTKLVPGQAPKVGIPWTIKIEGVATVRDEEGREVKGDILSLDHVSAAQLENPALLRAVYAVAPAGWPQLFTQQFNGGVLTALHTQIEGETWFGVTTQKRFLYITDGKPTILWEFPGRFVGANNSPDMAILEQLKGIKGLDSAKLIFPLPPYQGKKVPGTMQNRAFTLVVDDKESDKVGALFIPAATLKPNGDGDHRILDVEYNPPMPPDSDHSREAEAKRKDIQFLTSVTRAVFMPWWELGLFGVDGIPLTQAYRVLSAVKAGLLPTD